jgi:Tfp pilus assembly protein PilO
MANIPLKFNKKHILLLLLALALELAGLVGFYFHQHSTIVKLKADYSARQAELAQASKMGTELQPLKKKLQDEQDQLGHLEHALSTKEYIPTLLTQLEKLATDTHNKITNVKLTVPPPAAPAATDANGGTPAVATAVPDSYDKFLVDLEIQGPYQNVMDFLRKLTQFPKIVSVEKFQVSAQAGPKPGDEPMIRATLSFSAYILKEN